MTVYTPEHQAALAEFLATHELACGVGTEQSPCSIAAVNFVLTGRVTDDRPECMSAVIHKWVILMQDAMPKALRNSPAWKGALLVAPGTGTDPANEAERLALILDWMWGTVLPQVQAKADENGFGRQWRTMCESRTAQAAARAARAARAKTSASSCLGDRLRR